MNHDIKLKRSIDKGRFFKGPQTIRAIVSQLPLELLDTLNSRDIAIVLDAINTAYRHGLNRHFEIE